MSSLKRIVPLFLLVLGWMWIYRLPDGSALAEVKDETGLFSRYQTTRVHAAEYRTAEEHPGHAFP
ncbi:MAG TPA: hypothetical protein VGQ99_06365 [Tepidisphaeraceae bacterium]|jgi:hypothetical protein|nr:hypothetical protein [Tepidisphaeraceae bacterium]